MREKAKRIAYLTDPICPQNGVDLRVVGNKVDLIMEFFPVDTTWSYLYWRDRYRMWLAYDVPLYNVIVDYVIRDTINTVNKIGFGLNPRPDGNPEEVTIDNDGVLKMMETMPPIDTTIFNINKRLEWLKVILPFPTSGCIYLERINDHVQEYNTHLELDITGYSWSDVNFADYAQKLLTTVWYYFASRLPKPSKITVTYVRAGKEMDSYVFR